MVIWKLAPGRGCPAPDMGLGATGAALSEIPALWPILRKISPMTVIICTTRAAARVRRRTRTPPKNLAPPPNLV